MRVISEIRTSSNPQRPALTVEEQPARRVGEPRPSGSASARPSGKRSLPWLLPVGIVVAAAVVGVVVLSFFGGGEKPAEPAARGGAAATSVATTPPAERSAPAPAVSHEGEHYDAVTGQWVADRFDDGRYPQTRYRRLTEEELRGLSAADLKIMRNEIFARHGYAFQTAAMREYFARQPWYTAKDRSVQLSEVELYNVALIKKFE